MRKPLYKPDQRTLPIARRFRQDPSMEERRLWERLRGRIGPYIVDFVCLEARLVVEIDGPLHERENRKQKDALRQRWLEQEGYRVLRFTTMESYHDIDRVLNAIAAAVDGDGA